MNLEDLPLKECLDRTRGLLELPGLNRIVCLLSSDSMKDADEEKTAWLEASDLAVFYSGGQNDMTGINSEMENHMKAEDYLRLFIKYLSGTQKGVIFITDSEEREQEIRSSYFVMDEQPRETDHLVSEVNSYILNESLDIDDMYNAVNEAEAAAVIVFLPWERQKELYERAKSIINTSLWVAVEN
ncbi:MAG: hypothetical protein K6C99_07890 [Lachnospiraceae bacterium]|nr:hypothetical protein [Lachnospiraceae bacterium]